MRRNNLHLVAALGMLGVMSPGMAVSARPAEIDDEPPATAKGPAMAVRMSSKPAPKEHKHAREIARRLRQQARIDAKRAQQS